MMTKKKYPVNFSLTESKVPCVLIYDDDPEILFLCKAILEKKQYRVETLLRCENVINDIGRIKPDIILMDLWIPEIGGEKAIRMMKENPATQSVPVILFSANADISEICKKIKVNGYIEKPFDIAVFTETIRKHLFK